MTLAKPLMSPLSFLGDAANAVAIALITFILTAVNPVVGELAPKRLGMQYARQWSGLVASPLNILATVSRPLTWLLGKATDVGWWWCRRAGVRAQRIPPGDLGQSRCSPGSGLLCIRVTDISVSRFGAVALAAALPSPRPRRPSTVLTHLHRPQGRKGPHEPSQHVPVRPRPGVA